MPTYMHVWFKHARFWGLCLTQLNASSPHTNTSKCTYTHLPQERLRSGDCPNSVTANSSLLQSQHFSPLNNMDKTCIHKHTFALKGQAGPDPLCGLTHSNTHVHLHYNEYLTGGAAPHEGWSRAGQWLLRGC